MKFCYGLYKTQEILRKGIYKIFRESLIRHSFHSCGKNVHVAEKCDIKGITNITVGDGTTIGPHSVLWTTKARLIIGEKVILGPHVTMVTGNHRINLIGKYMADVTTSEKEYEDDQDIRIERDVWIGTNATILKGVTVAEGCVIAAGAVVTKSTEAYGIYAGCPAVKITARFSDEDICKHKAMLGYEKTEV